MSESISQQKIFQIHRNSHGWPKRGSSAKNAVLVSLPSGDDLELDPRLGPISESIQTGPGAWPQIFENAWPDGMPFPI